MTRESLTATFMPYAIGAGALGGAVIGLLFAQLFVGPVVKPAGRYPRR